MQKLQQPKHQQHVALIFIVIHGGTSKERTLLQMGRRRLPAKVDDPFGPAILYMAIHAGITLRRYVAQVERIKIDFREIQATFFLKGVNQ